MKKGIFSSYIHGIKDIATGESYSNILKYFFPEYITALMLYSALHLLDAHWIAHLKSTSAYATLGVTNTLMHFIMKIAEGVSVGSIVLCGQHNGAGNYEKVGRTLTDTFWLTCIVGATISGSLYFGAYLIYQLYGVPAEMINLGIPFLRLRAIGVFFTFVYFAFVAFLRGIKNTRTPMNIFVIGAGIFIFFDYALIFGKFGFPEMKFYGSALATTIQYASMFVMSAYVVLVNEDNKKYCINLFAHLSNFTNVKRLMVLSWPVVVDKATMAAAYIWLGAMIAPMGKYALASLTVIKDMERIAFLPAIAFAQVITFLASNDFGASNFGGIKSNIKKTIFLSSIFCFVFLFGFSYNPKFFISFFDQKDAFTQFASQVFPILSVFVFFDLVQLVLSGALRGIGDVKIVMWTRMVVCFGWFFPASYYISKMAIADQVMKFTLIYVMFYIGNMIMTAVYINRFRAYSWKQNSGQSTVKA